MAHCVKANKGDTHVIDNFVKTKDFDFSLKFQNCNAIFAISVEINERADRMVISVEDSIDLKAFRMKLSVIDEWENDEDLLSLERSISKPFEVTSCSTIKIKLLSFEEVINKDELLKNLISYVTQGPMVTLVCSDGSVYVSKRLLKARCPTLSNMLNHDSKERRTMTIDLKDFKTKSLESFCHFLSSCVIKDGSETGLDLIILSDKYDVQDLKKAAETYVLDNLRDFDRKEVLDLFFLPLSYI